MSTDIDNQGMQASASVPTVRLTGTETGAGDLSVREKGGTIEIYDESAASVVTNLAAHTIRTLIQIADSQQSGLAADATGVVWTSNFVNKIDPQNLNGGTVRASWSAGATASVTDIEIYDETAGSVLGNVSGNSGTDAEGSVSGFTAGNSVVARANVTIAGTAGATTSVDYVVLENTYEV